LPRNETRNTTKMHPFSFDPWRLRETQFDTGINYLAETLFALGNGTVGLRGTHEESYLGPAGTSQEGNYLNGFYESEAIHYPESAYGLAHTNQFMLNLPNAKRVELWLDDEQFNVTEGQVSAYERTLDFRTGILTRTVRWTSAKGKEIILTSERLVSFQRRHLFAIRYQITSVNFAGPAYLTSAIDTEVKALSVPGDPRVGSSQSGATLQLQQIVQTAGFCALEHRTANSGFHLLSAMSNEAHGWQLIERDPGVGKIAEAQSVQQQFFRTLQVGETARITKYGCYFSSRDFPAEELKERSQSYLNDAKISGFDVLCLEQKNYLADFWRQTDIEIAGDAALQQGMHFNQFHLLQSIGQDGKTNIAAKGLTGEGYEGHYFWDTEIYVFPFFLYSKPEIARKLLEYRYNILDQARERARQMSHEKGALYPWRTIAGEECSSYYPAGTAQYHINADIAYAVKQYLDATGDDQFLVDCAAEMVLETARIWIGLGHFSPLHPERFCIDEVTGPDEYTALVNNNYYTNSMAKMHLKFALSIVAKLGSAYPADYQRIAQKIALTAEEVAIWDAAARQMYLPYDESLGIHAQDDSFLSKKQWDFAATPKDKYPLLLHFHPLVIYRHQVCKQADLMLAMLLLSDQFTLEEKKRNFDYYEKVTTHDSSLSYCIFSIIASEIGYHDKAYAFFMETARMDLDDTHHNTRHGVHTAAMAGSWMCVSYGFAGMRVIDGQPRFNPTLPKQWSHYQFQIHLHGCLLQVRVTALEVSYRLLEGSELNLQHAGQTVQLNQNHRLQRCTVNLKAD